MTNQQIELRIGRMVKLEKRVSHEIVRLIQLAYRRKIHLQRGYKSVFDWLTKEFKYSEGSANRRIQAAKILEDVPEAAVKLETGVINLSTLTQAQSAIRREEVRTGAKIPAEQKQQIVAELDGKTMRETELFLAQTFPEQAPREKIRPINDEQTLLQLTVDAEFMELLEQAKALRSNCENSDTLETLKSSLRTQIAAAQKKQSVLRRELDARADSQCEYVDQQSNRRCEGKHRIQNDHIHPKAKGGSDQIQNRRLLCRAHNLLEAEREFGIEKMQMEIRKGRR